MRRSVASSPSSGWPPAAALRSLERMAFWTRQDDASKAAPPTYPGARHNGQAVEQNRAVPDEPTKEDAMGMLKRDGNGAVGVESGDLLLGAGAEFEGKLSFAGTVRIDARFKGSITTNDVLVVGEHARIDAEIVCGTIIVHGEINGNIKAKTAVELRHPARMRGNIESPSIAMEKGVVFQGDSRMQPAEKNVAQRPVTVAAVTAQD